MLMTSAALYYIWECEDADAGNNMPISSFSDNSDKACDTRALLQHMLSINSDHQLESIEVISNQTDLFLTINPYRRSVLSEIFLPTGAHVCVSL
jgi:hypothetical protein